MSSPFESPVFASSQVADVGSWTAHEDIFAPAADEPSPRRFEEITNVWGGFSEDTKEELPEIDEDDAVDEYLADEYFEEATEYDEGPQEYCEDATETAYVEGLYENLDELEESGEVEEDEAGQAEANEAAYVEGLYENLEEVTEYGEVEEGEADQEEADEIAEPEFEEASFEEASFEEDEEGGFPSGLSLTPSPGNEGKGEEHWDPNNAGLPIYATGPSVQGMKLSPNFTVRELVTSGSRAADRARISPRLVTCLQAIRDRAGRPVLIISGYRSWARNVAVYKARDEQPKDSRHCSGQAADIKIKGMSGLEIAKLAIDACGKDIAIGVHNDNAHVDVRGEPATWTYFRGPKNTATLREVAAYRRSRTGPAPAPAPPMPVPPARSDRAAGIVRRGAFSGCTGKAQPGAQAMAAQWKRLTGRKAGIYSCRCTSFGTPSLHGEGRAIDLYANVSDDVQRAQAEAYIGWLQANAVELQVPFVIWNRRQWSWKNRAKGWRPYRGDPHTDHIHVELSWEGARTPSALFAGSVPGGGPIAPPPTPRKPAVLPDSFFRELKAISARLPCDPGDLLAVMVSESGADPAAQNPNGRATGLIQFMPATLQGLGWTSGPDEFRKLSAEQQLPYVERYFRPHRGKLTSPGRLYQATFLPATLSNSDESTILAAPAGPRPRVYQSNKGLDVNADGVITVGDLTARINRVKQGRRWQELISRLSSE